MPAFTQQGVDGLNLAPSMIRRHLREIGCSLNVTIVVHKLNLNTMNTNLPIQVVLAILKVGEQRDSALQTRHLLPLDRLKAIVVKGTVYCVLLETLVEVFGGKGPNATTEVSLAANLPCHKQWIFVVGEGWCFGWTASGVQLKG